MIVRADEEQIARGAEIIRRGGLVAFPTETVYGLGANALDADAVRRIYAAKGRPSTSPLIVHVDGEAMARSLVEAWPELAEKLARAFWPGPLTMVLKKAAMVPDVVTAGLDSVGIRMPNHPVALALIRQAGVPIAAPSANRFTELSPTTAAHVFRSLGNAVELILASGATQLGIESTVVSLTRNPPVILRPGIIGPQELERVTGSHWEHEAKQTTMAAESPGQHPRHYAPRTKLFVLGPGSKLAKGRGRIIDMPGNSAEYAARLYAELYKADAEGWDWIALRKPPETEEWDGIRDRLQRASED